MSRGTSPLWNHFTIPDGNFRLAKCNHCSVVVQRGTENAPRGKCYNRNMQKHMVKYHEELMEIAKTQAAVKLQRPKKIDQRDESVRGNIPIFNLRSQEDRAAFIRKVKINTDGFVCLWIEDVMTLCLWSKYNLLFIYFTMLLNV